MERFSGLGKVLIGIGLVFLIAGLIMVFFDRLPFNLFRLPGDMVIEKKNFKIYIPVVTSIVLSIILTLLFYLISKIK